MSILDDFAAIANGSWSAAPVTSSLSVPLADIPWSTIGSGLSFAGQALPDLSRLGFLDYKPDTSLGAFNSTGGTLSGLDGGVLGDLSKLGIGDFKPGFDAADFTAGPQAGAPGNLSSADFAVDNAQGMPNLGVTGVGSDAAGAGTAPTGAAGVTKAPGFLSTALNTVKPLAPAAAMMLLNKLLAKDTGEAADKAEERLNKSADLASGTAEDLLARYKSGEIQPADQYQIEQWYKNAVAQVDAFYAKAGMSDSTAHAEARRNVDQQRVAMMDAARQGLLTQGLNAVGISQGPLATALQVASNADTQAGAAQTSMLQALGMLAAMGMSGAQPNINVSTAPAQS